ncbi:hypothetical protein AWM79_12700 [Pseudomonas agarici]|uniref:Uncharacterized protein n=1 Tax=Pseudomonas agarici TaxID=46677 RepID=A0A0X1T234_PSEAA|nr:hypothetical protein AWM79_12700 [Pseudomonas agarici]
MGDSPGKTAMLADKSDLDQHGGRTNALLTSFIKMLLAVALNGRRHQAFVHNNKLCLRSVQRD